MTNRPQISFAFFGTSRFSVLVLDELEKAGLIPILIVTTPDRQRGRGMELQPTPVKEWAQKRGIEVLAPETLDDSFAETLRRRTLSNAALSKDPVQANGTLSKDGTSKSADSNEIEAFVVVSYGKIIPKSIIDLPSHKTLNVHASLLPKHRGASPLQSAMLDDDKRTGITIIRLDEKMDHGPIIAQKEVAVNEWPTYEDFEAQMAQEGGRLLAETLPQWVAGKTKELEQNHSQATYAKKITKEEGLIDAADLNVNAPADKAYAAFRKIQAFHQWPTAYFFVERAAKKIRVKITRASFKDGKLTIERVIPEDSREMDYRDFLKGNSAA